MARVFIDYGCDNDGGHTRAHQEVVAAKNISIDTYMHEENTNSSFWSILSHVFNVFVVVSEAAPVGDGGLVWGECDMS